MSRDLLQRVPLFETLREEELQQVYEISRRERFEPGQQIFEEGEIGDKFYLILRGAVRISKMIPGVGEEALAILRSGDYFGEMALIDRFPRSAHAICQEESELMVLQKPDLDEVLFFNQELANKILWVFCKTLSARLRETNDKIRALFAMAKSF